MPEELELPPEQHNYFASMADIMAGMVFLVLVLLAAITILSKADRQQYEVVAPNVQEMQQKIEERRRLAIKHRIELLVGIAHDLEGRGIAVHIDEDLGVLRLPAAQFFYPGKAVPDPGQQDRMNALLSVLAARLPCYAEGSRPAPADCPPTENQRLASVRLDVFAGDGDLTPGAGVFRNATELSKARGVVMISALFKEADRVFGLRSPGGERLLKSTGYGSRWIEAPFFNNVGHVDLQLNMAMPAELPDAAPIIRPDETTGGHN